MCQTMMIIVNIDHGENTLKHPWGHEQIIHFNGRCLYVHRNQLRFMFTQDSQNPHDFGGTQSHVGFNNQTGVSEIFSRLFCFEEGFEGIQAQ